MYPGIEYFGNRSGISLTGGKVKKAIGAGVDAIIVQDLGVAAVVRDLYPTLPLHASI